MGVTSANIPGSDGDNTDSTGIRGGTTGAIIGNVGDRLKTDALVSLLPSGAVQGFVHGKVTASTISIVRNTAYSEQTSNAQRSVVSSSASDAAAGTGARTIKITYLAADQSGPFTETITLNGTTAVNTVSTTICFVEKIEVLSYGSFRSNIGIISLKTTTGGGGSTIFSIAVGDNQTYQAHHYTPLGKTTYVTGISVSASSGDSGLFYLIYSTHSASVDFDTGRQMEFQCPLSGSYFRPFTIPTAVAGHFSVGVVPDSAGIYYATIDFYDV